MTSKIRNCTPKRNCCAAPVRRSSAAQTRLENNNLRIEDLDAPPSQAGIVNMLTDDPYWHNRIHRLLDAAGFETTRIEREEIRPLWQVWLTSTTCDLARDTEIAAKQIHSILRRGGIEIQLGDFNIADRRRDKLRCVFFLNVGAPGVLQPRPFYARNQAVLWPQPL